MYQRSRGMVSGRVRGRLRRPVPLALVAVAGLVIVAGGIAVIARHVSTPACPSMQSCAAGGVVSPFVTTCGTDLCADGSRLTIKGATVHGHYDDPARAIADASAGNLNTLDLVDFDTHYRQLADAESPGTWGRIDALIAKATAKHLHIVLNLSEYGWALQTAGHTMNSSTWQSDWNEYLSFVANRVNTATGVAYKHDPSIAMVEIWGEIPAPNYPDAVGTTAQITSFYSNSLARWKAVAPDILVSTGGFSYLNDGRSGIDWKTIMGDPNDAVCAFEINSAGDRDATTHRVTSYCQSLGKPWFLAAWNSCRKPSSGTWDITDWATDSEMASHADDMYRIAMGGAPATYRAVGSDFWNLGPQSAPTCDVGPQFPRTWDVVQNA